jgi:hypothetical protein
MYTMFFGFSVWLMLNAPIQNLAKTRTNPTLWHTFCTRSLSDLWLKMKIVLALALLAGSAHADHVQAAAYVNSFSCAGEAAVYSSSIIDCETNAGTSYKIQCTNSTAAQLITYAYTDDCSGDPTISQDYPLGFGCTAEDTSSSMITCVSGVPNKSCLCIRNEKITVQSNR